jgi:autotransporter-associated beta strand protein
LGSAGTYAGNITNDAIFEYSSSSAQTLSGQISGAGELIKSGAGVLTLSGTNTYTGNTTISAGTLKLANNSAINLTSGLSIAAGASLDTVSLTVPPSSSVPLTASGTGTVVGTTAAAIIGVSGSTNDLGTRTLILNYDGANPALYLAGGTLNLNNNPFTINGAVLTNGVYTIIAQSDAPAMIGSVASSTVGGTALTGKMGTVSLSGNTVVLTVSNAGPSGPATLTNSVSGNVLTLSWPAGQGWRLESQTNALSIGISNNWAEAAGSSVSSTNFTINPALPTVFYRLVFP